MKKFVIGGLVLVLLAVAVGMFLLVSNLDQIVARVIEKAGSDVTATTVAVGGVDIALRDGRASLQGFTIDSPDGFEAERAFELGEVAVELDLESLRGDVIVVEKVLVQAPVVYAEVHEDGSSNLMALQKNVQEYSARFTGSEDGSDGGSGGGDAEQKRLRIQSFVFEQGRIEVDASQLGLEPRTVDLPAVRLNDIGGAQGAKPDQIAQAVLGALTRQAVETVAKAGIEAKAREELEKEAEKQGKDLLKKIGG